jgi:hypothetical protein
MNGGLSTEGSCIKSWSSSSSDKSDAGEVSGDDKGGSEGGGGRGGGRGSSKGKRWSLTSSSDDSLAGVADTMAVPSGG